MKYRIKQVGDWYYPQVKKFGFFWINMNTGWDEYYKDIESAYYAIDIYINSKNKGKQVIIHQYGPKNHDGKE